MRSLWWLAIAVTACGEVNKLPDASVPDVYEHDAAVALSCAPSETVCNNLCVNVMTDEQYCGSCNTSCPATHGCAAGTCLPANLSCSRVREIDPAAPNDIYTNPNNGTFFYCDFDTGTQYSSLTLSKYTAIPAGNTLVRATDLQGPGGTAFIKLFNRQGGAVAPVALAGIGNCCYEVGATVGLQLGGKMLTPAQNGTSQCIDTIPVGTYQFMVDFQAQTQPLADDYFTTKPATEVTGGCGDTGNNPGMSWKKTLF